MTKTKRPKSSYVIGKKRYSSFKDAAADAIDLSLQTESREVTIVEHGQTGTYHITVVAQAEQV